MGCRSSVTSRWLDIGQALFLRVYVHKLAKKERGQYPAILTEQTWATKNLLQRSSGGQKGRQAEPHNYRNRITCMHGNRNPCNPFLMVKMASGMDHGHVCPTTTTTNDDVAQHGGHPANTRSCSLGLKDMSLILDIHMMFNWLLSYQNIR